MKNKKKEKILMPIWADIILTIASRIILFFTTRIKFNRKVIRKQKDGCLLVYNHYSNQDQFIIKSALGFRRVNYVIASSYMWSQPLGTLLKLARAISKDQFKPDLAAIRKIKKALDQKGIVAIAPTGQTTIDGEPSFLPNAIVKLIRMAKSDVVALRNKGVYLSFPKWRKSKRRCKIISEFEKIINKEDIEKLSDEEIYNLVYNSINVSEDKEQELNPRVIKGKSLTSGLENALVVCPKCNARHSFDSIKNTLVCSNCNNTIVMDKYGKLHAKNDSSISFKTIHEHYVFQRNYIGKLYVEGHSFQDEVMVKSNLVKKDSLDEVGSGVVTLNKDTFNFKGTILNETKEIEFKLDLIQQLPFHPGNRFEIPNSEMFFRAYPKDVKHVMDYVLIVDYLNEQKVLKNDNNN